MTTQQRDAKGQFVRKGASPEPSSAPGDDGGEPFLVELQANWALHGAETIEKVRNDRPQDYLRLAASSLGKLDKGPPPDPLAGLTDDEIADELRRILALLAADGADPRA